MSKESKKLCNCNMGCSPSLREKGLCPLTSTSILCNRELLQSNERLKLLCSNGENEYYLIDYNIKGNYSVIMHVEEGYCILVDYKEIVYDDEKEEKIIVDIPQELCKYKYTIQRKDGRDSVIRDENQTITDDIGEIILSNRFKREHGYITSYLRETYDERLCSVSSLFRKGEDINLKSHHVRVKITSMDILDTFIDDIILSTTWFDGVYYNKKNCRDKKGREFVEWCQYDLI